MKEMGRFEDWNLVCLQVFLHICSFLDSGFVLQNVSLVCKRLYAILANWKTWKIRQDKRWGRNGVYPPVPGKPLFSLVYTFKEQDDNVQVFVVDEETFPWSRACWKREEQIKLWRDNGALFRHVELKSHIACVDAVHLFDVSCAAVSHPKLWLVLLKLILFLFRMADFWPLDLAIVT